MYTKNRHWRNRTRFNRGAIAPFLEVRPRLRQLMVRNRARGEQCQLDKGRTLLGPGLRFRDGSLLRLPFSPRVPLLRRRYASSAKKPMYPVLVAYQGRHLKMLRAPVQRRKF